MSKVVKGESKVTNSAVGSASNLLDPSQLLLLCHRMRENMNLLEKNIQSTQLRLTTLSYINDDVEDSSLKCFDSLIGLCNLSQLVISLIDELQVKLAESSESSAQYQIASQQLMFLTSEWYDNLAPKLNETLKLAQKQSNMNMTKEYARKRGANKKQDEDMESAYLAEPAESRAREALLRLRESMRENERLIVSIAGNIDYTRATIETIYDSLHSTKFNLSAGEENTKVAIEELKKRNYYKFSCTIITVLVLVALAAAYIYWLLFSR